MLLLNRDELSQIPPIEPMIGGVMDKGTVTLLTAQPAAFKSFLAIDWACSYATGKAWQGHEIDNQVTYGGNDKPAPGKVLYVAAEGAKGISKRISAWESAWGHEVPAERLITSPQPIQLKDYNSVLELIAHIQEETYGFIILDTLARCTLGMEENSATDMGRTVDALYKIREAMGPDGTLLAIHHEGKNGTIRGSSALYGGVDQQLSLRREGSHITLQDGKRKDGMELSSLDLEVTKHQDSLIIQSPGTTQHKHNELALIMANTLAEVLPMSKSELKSATGLGDLEFYRHLNNGLKDGLIKATNDKNPRYLLGSES